MEEKLANPDDQEMRDSARRAFDAAANAITDHNLGANQQIMLMSSIVGNWLHNFVPNHMHGDVLKAVTYGTEKILETHEKHADLIKKKEDDHYRLTLN